LLLADAHTLPFRDGTFDRVLHVGGINGYGDRARGLAEMARVARRGTPIVVVDEELDPHRTHSLYNRLAFKAITLYDQDPRAPRELVPPGTTAVEVSPVSRFYYCLRFSLDGRASSEPPMTGRPVAKEMTKGVAAMPSTDDVSTMLPDAELKDFRDNYDENLMDQFLGQFFPQAYPPSAEYVAAIGKVFYSAGLPSDDPSPTRVRLSAADRERCLVAILASRGAGLNLAIHMYMALMNSVSPGEVGNILFLSGIYTGVDHFADTLKLQMALLQLLHGLWQQRKLTVPEVVGALNQKFPQ